MTLDEQGIIEFLDTLDKESKAFKEDALRICWYMRGGLSYEDAIMLSSDERTIISKIVEDNMETTNKTGLPFF